MKKFIPERLKEIRDLKSISAFTLAESCGIGATAIYNYEKGIRVPSEDILKKFSEILKTDIEYFYKTENVFQTPSELLDLITSTKKMFNATYNPIKNVLSKNGKIDPDVVNLADLMLGRDNLNSNNISNLLNRLEFLNQSLSYLEEISKVKEDIHPDTFVLNELNKYDIDELFSLLNNLSRLGILKMIMFGKEILEEEQNIIDTTVLNNQEKMSIAKIVEGAVIKKRMESSEKYTETEISDYIINDYGNVNLSEINYSLPVLNNPITPEIESRFEKFLNDMNKRKLL